MSGSHSILEILENEFVAAQVDATWSAVSVQFCEIESQMKNRLMNRREVSFHDHVKLLGYLTLITNDIKGDILEIGVWKGKSLAFMRALSTPTTKIIGIDPCEIFGQFEELTHFKEGAFPEATIIHSYSSKAVEAVVSTSKSIRLLHIDGGHTSSDVWADFFIYSQLVVSGGFIVFDDYGDTEHSPEVGPAVDRLREMGLFHNFSIWGSLPPFSNSYILQRN